MAAGRAVPRDGRLVQQCAAGLVPLRVEPGGTRLSFEVPPSRSTPIGPEDGAAIAGALGLEGPAPRFDAIDVGPVWLTAELPDAAAVLALRPDMAALASIGRRLHATGVTVHGADRTRSIGADVAVRSFAPAAGVPEDPVCGSGNACVALQRRAAGARDPYVAAQGEAIGRAGRIEVRYRGDAVEVGGATVVCVSGTLAVR
jgi:PhzF family phenazine biosynthesis protein